MEKRITFRGDKDTCITFKGRGSRISKYRKTVFQSRKVHFQVPTAIIAVGIWALSPSPKNPLLLWLTHNLLALRTTTTLAARASSRATICRNYLTRNALRITTTRTTEVGLKVNKLACASRILTNEWTESTSLPPSYRRAPPLP